MPDVQTNLSVWGETYDWSGEGDEWSAHWGGTHAMWLAAIQPRIQSFAPTGTILEVAPGFGRWTQYLKDLAERLIAVDLSERCIEHCRARFADSTNIEFHVNDGRSLDMVEDGSIDFAISLDSLVHVDTGVLESYVRQLASKLSADGVGLLHHSNAGAYPALTRLTKRVPRSVRRPLVERGLLLDLDAARDQSVTAERFAELCADAGLSCVGQEKISWEHGRFMTDAFSIFTRRGSHWDRSSRSVSNPWFSLEARRNRRLWAPPSFERQ